MAICVCKPLVIVNGAPAVKAPVSMTCNVPVALPEGVAAAKRLGPLGSPTVVPEMEIPVQLGVNSGAGGLLKFTFTTLGGTVPPHSVPQFRMKAVVSLVSVGSKTAA